MSIILLKEYFSLQYIDFMFIVKVAFITAVAWVPLQLIYVALNWLDPSDHVKVMKSKA